MTEEELVIVMPDAYLDATQKQKDDFVVHAAIDGGHDLGENVRVIWKGEE